MHCLESEDLSLHSFSKFGNKLLRNHEGLKQIVKRIELAKRKCSILQRQPRPPCYHPGAAQKPATIKNSSSFLSPMREQSNISLPRYLRVKSQFNYSPNFQPITRRSPSWTFAKSSPTQPSKQEYFKICPRNPLLQSRQNPEQEISEQQSVLTLNTQEKQDGSFTKKQSLKNSMKDTMYNSVQKNRFQILSSIELTKFQMKNQQKTKRQTHSRGYVNMMTQTSRPSAVKNYYSSGKLDCKININNSINRAHKFSSYIHRSQQKPKPQPQYVNLNYDIIKPKTARGHIKFALFKGRLEQRRTHQTQSHSSLYNLSLEKLNIHSPNFKKMRGRPSELFPSSNPNIKKKGDSTILKILGQASKF